MPECAEAWPPPCPHAPCHRVCLNARGLGLEKSVGLGVGGAHEAVVAPDGASLPSAAGGGAVVDGGAEEAGDSRPRLSHAPAALPVALSITFANLLKTCRKFADLEVSQIEVFNLYKGSFSGSRRTSHRDTPHPGVRPAAIRQGARRVSYRQPRPFRPTFPLAIAERVGRKIGRGRPTRPAARARTGWLVAEV